MVVERAREALIRLDQYLTGQWLAGPDPYDGLAGWLGGRVPSGHVRQAIIQGVKRSPIDLRPALGVRPVRMTKTLALVTDALHTAPWLPEGASRRKTLLDEIVDRRTGPTGGWGYEFDVQTRWGFYPAGSPNIIVTAFVLEALRDSPEHLEAVRSGVRDWLLGSMRYEGIFRYVPGSTVLIHNANLLGARALERVEPGHPAVARGVRRTLECQRANGTWPYGEGAGLEWVDGFHTAYVLLALADLDEALPDGEGLGRGVKAYASRLFSPEGEPFYFADRPGPTDIHNIATGLLAVAVLRDHIPGGDELLGRVLEHLLRLQGDDGAFRSSSRAPAYMRWNQAHAQRALAEVAR
ncbi:MAG: hypothetical protein QOE58_781 [Actinomycetota bacterium]|nr:hypothetical protein [Actinomycetota bacterium]